jgi:hypothetical protein
MATRTAAKKATAGAPAIALTQTGSFLKEVESLLNDKSAVGPAAVDPSFGFDCSGLVYYALQHVGVASPPRTAQDQANWSTPITRSQLKPGDLVFSHWPGDVSSAVGHVQIYIGGGKLIQSPGNSTGHVEYTTLAQDAGHIVGYGRMPLKGAASTKVADWTTETWATLALKAANVETPQGQKKIPITANNVQNMERWISAESGHGNWWSKANPLNGTGYGQANGSYSSLTAAAEAFGKEINQSNFSQIRAAMVQNAPTSLFSAAVVGSPWASGHYGGNPKAIANTSPNTTKGPGIGATTAKPLAYDQVVAGIVKAANTPNGKWSLALTNAFNKLSPSERQSALKTATSKVQAQYAVDTSIGADIGRGYDKTASAIASAASSVTSVFSPFTKVLGDLGSAAFWKRIGIGGLGVVLIGAGVLIFLQSTKPVQAAEGAALKVV